MKKQPTDFGFQKYFGHLSGAGPSKQTQKAIDRSTPWPFARMGRGTRLQVPSHPRAGSEIAGRGPGPKQQFPQGARQ